MRQRHRETEKESMTSGKTYRGGQREWEERETGRKIEIERA